MQGQVNIGGECFDNVVITLGKSAINPQKKQYIGDILFIDDAFNLKTENIQKTKLLEKWLFGTLTEEKKEKEKKEEKKDDEKTSNLDKALSVMEAIATEHKPYSQNPPRSGTSDNNKATMDCSEFVSWYLYNLGITKDVKAISTLDMTNQANFRKAIGSEKIEFVDSSDGEDFIPQKGDIFVWRDGDGHTGIVLEYDKAKDAVWVLESIGKSCSADESFNKDNEGDTDCNNTRKAIYRRNKKVGKTGALYGHRGWKGYFRVKLN